MSTDRPPRPGAGDDDPRVDDRLDEVWEALDDGDLETALELAESLVADHPESGNAALGLAAAQYEAGSIRATLEAAERAGDLGVEDDTLRRWYVAAAHHYLWDFDAARAILTDLTREDPDFAEAWYLLAQVSEIEGDEVGARRGYEQAFMIEPDRFPRPHRVDEGAMRDAVQAARDDLPPRFQEILDELAVVIEALPSRELARAESEEDDPIPPDVLGLFVGTNQLEQSVFDPVRYPGVIFLFQRNLERVCSEPEVLIEEIRTTLWHELAHYLGFEEDQMADLGLE